MSFTAFCTSLRPTLWTCRQLVIFKRMKKNWRSSRGTSNFLVAKSLHVSRRIDVVQSGTLIVMSEGVKFQVHLGLSHGKCNRSPQYEISVQEETNKQSRTRSTRDSSYVDPGPVRHDKREAQQSLVYAACPEGFWWQLSACFFRIFVKSVVTVPPTNNIKCICRVKGQMKKKITFPSGRESKERSTTVPACFNDFF